MSAVTERSQVFQIRVPEERGKRCHRFLRSSSRRQFGAVRFRAGGLRIGWRPRDLERHSQCGAGAGRRRTWPWKEVPWKEVPPFFEIGKRWKEVPPFFEIVEQAAVRGGEVVELGAPTPGATFIVWRWPAAIVAESGRLWQPERGGSPKEVPPFFRMVLQDGLAGGSSSW